MDVSPFAVGGLLLRDPTDVRSRAPAVYSSLCERTGCARLWMRLLIVSERGTLPSDEMLVELIVGDPKNYEGVEEPASSDRVKARPFVSSNFS